MLVTKLKNNRKFAIFLMIVAVLAGAVVMVSAYPIFAVNLSEGIADEVQEEKLTELSDELKDGVCFLSNQAYGYIDQSEMNFYYGMEGFMLLRKYMDYEIFDFDGKALLGEDNSSKVKELVKEETDYAFRTSIVINEDSEIQDVQVDGNAIHEKNAYQLEQRIFDGGLSDNLEHSFEGALPKEVKVIYGMSEEQLDGYMSVSDDFLYQYAVRLSYRELYQMYERILIVVIAVMGILIAVNKGWRVHEWKLFRAPLEIVLAVCLYVVIGNNMTRAAQVWSVINRDARYGYVSGISYDMQILLNVAMWAVVFGIVLWGMVCMAEVFVLKKEYLKERTLCVWLFRWSKAESGQYGDKIKQGADDAAGFFQRVWRKIKGYFSKVYNEFLHMDLQEDSNKLIIKALVINFFLLLIITCFWFYGIFALIIYSVILFLILRRYSQDIKQKYALLLESTNLLAEGNLDVPIDGDLGIFNPIKTEIQKIQKGFKKAVQEEVKSERMKTELITNVSHDLKTPLTAIITYVDLLKLEEDPEKRKEYLGVLEKKSLRLKVLIEDLFEISKATSKNVTMNFMKVDIVGLLKQVGLECDEKIQAAHLEFRWSMPEGKVVMLLDSQKTYRIFENLIINITKYALPHTRVYIELIDDGSHVLISMKNVSAAELNFNTEEITDRFVRGDASRNTEGSGLGLAIAKSFTELQYGTLQISTDADLFKVVIRLPKRSESEEQENS